MVHDSKDLHQHVPSTIDIPMAQEKPIAYRIANDLLTTKM